MKITKLQEEENKKYCVKISANYSKEYEAIKKKTAFMEHNASDIEKMSSQEAEKNKDEILE